MDNYIVKELVGYYNVQNRNAFEFYKRTLDYYALTIVLEGSLTYIIDDTKYVIHKNDAVFLKPGMTREAHRQKNKPLWFVNFNFLLHDDFSLSLPTYLKNSFSMDIKNLLKIFPYTYIPRDDFSKSQASCLLNCILFDLLEKNAAPFQNEYINKIVKIIDEKITENLTLQDISSMLNLSKEYVSYIFKKETGKTLTNYINEQKMIVAKEFILNSSMSLVEISKVLSFNNYNYFLRLFKKHFNQTPIEMRKMYKNIL